MARQRAANLAASASAAGRWAHPLAAYIWPAYLACMLVWVSLRLEYVPAPLPASSNATLFAEARAMQHVDVLATHLVDRQVSMPGLAAATQYLLDQLEALKQGAAHRVNVDVKVDKLTVSGAVGMTFTRIPFTNAYRALDNVALVVTPKGTERLKAVLVVSHHDSAVCSQGAADDAAQAAVMLEVARALLAHSSLPPTPVIFLWTGGEEPISPAAHGWMSQSPLYSRVGAFINLEAIGGYGLPIVFQHSGSWVLEAYARGNPLPRGSRVAQDVFDLHIIPADSDFRMFSARHYGSLPGIDLAFILGSTSYHSYLDAPTLLRPGVVQEMGESLLGGMLSVSRALAARQQGGQVQAGRQQQDVRDARKLSVYLDVLAYFMVVYSDELAARLHVLPVLILASLPLLLLPSSKSKGKAGGLLQAYRVMGLGAACCLASMLLAVGLPAGLGAVRTLVSGKPMVWFATHWLGHLQFLPVATVGGLLPWGFAVDRARTAAPMIREGTFIALLLQGCGFTSSVMGVLLTALGMAGNASLFAINGALAGLASLLAATDRMGMARVLALLALSTLPVALGSGVVVVFIEVMMERMALGGYVHPVVADCVVGVLSGLGVLATTCGVFLVLIAHSLKPGTRRWLLGGLTALSLAAAALSAAYWPAYTPRAPKRAVISHLVQTKAAEAAVEGLANHSSGIPGVAMEVVSEAVSIAGADSTPIVQVINMSAFQLVPTTGHERAYTPLYPLDSMLHGILVAVPDETVPPVDRQLRYKHILPSKEDRTPCSQATGTDMCKHGSLLSEPLLQLERPVSQLPYLQLVSVAPGRDQQHVRLQLRMFSQLPCWGILNITAPGMAAWSFTQQLSHGPDCQECGDGHRHGVRFTTQDEDPFWNFWLELRKAEAHQGSSRAVAAEPGIMLNKLLQTLPAQAAGAAGGGVEHAPQAAGAEADSSSSSSSSSSGVHGDSSDTGSSVTGLLGLQLRIELSTTYLQRTLPLRRVMHLLPEHVAETWLATVYQSYWEL